MRRENEAWRDHGKTKGLEFGVQTLLLGKLTQPSRAKLAAQELMDRLRAGKASVIELPDVNDPKFALRIFADSKIEGRIAMGIVGAVRNGPIEWLIGDK
jgi:hypothetical protein